MRGFFGIGIWNAQHEVNIGTLFRSAYAFGASFVFTVGRKYRRQASDTTSTTIHVPYYQYLNIEEMLVRRPNGTQVVCVECNIKYASRPLPQFCHPLRAMYLLGSEGNSLPDRVLEKNQIVTIPSSVCLNVATAGSIIIYDPIATEANNAVGKFTLSRPLQCS